VRAAGNPNTAALQAALRARGLYRAGLDGIRGPATIRALRRAQARAGLAADGVVGPRTRRALRLRLLGGRLLHAHMHGTDVLALQFALAEHGFPCGTFDGVFGDHTVVALRRFQRFAGLAVDGVAGAGTVRALHAPPPHAPFSIAWPLDRRIGDPFGPRGLRFHEGIDLPAATGSGVVAVAPGRVSWAGFRSGGWGLLVVVAHRDHVRSLYAHLSRVDVRVGERVEAGFQIGRVGATGDATGPHLHFELRVRGAAINPVPALQRYH
jgi:peptidoglycan hydrolase-like protein with peptidoglycan-binding domain